jgi:hypothetical protein
MIVLTMSPDLRDAVPAMLHGITRTAKCDLWPQVGPLHRPLVTNKRRRLIGGMLAGQTTNVCRKPTSVSQPSQILH